MNTIVHVPRSIHWQLLLVIGSNRLNRCNATQLSIIGPGRTRETDASQGLFTARRVLACEQVTSTGEGRRGARSKQVAPGGSKVEWVLARDSRIEARCVTSGQLRHGRCPPGMNIIVLVPRSIHRQLLLAIGSNRLNRRCATRLSITGPGRTRETDASQGLFTARRVPT